MDMERHNTQGPVNVSAAVGAVNENPPESLSTLHSEAAERERAARSVEAPAESSAEGGVTETHIDRPRPGATSPDSIGSGPPD